MKTTDLMDEAIRMFKTDAATSRALGISKAFLSRIRSGDDRMSPLVAAKLARLLGHRPIAWQLIAHREQAKTKAEAEFWQSLIEELKR